MTRRDMYEHMQQLNRCDYEMGYLSREAFARTELALAVDADRERERRHTLAAELRATRTTAASTTGAPDDGGGV